MRADLKDMSLMVLRTRGPAKLPKGYKLTMHISQSDAESVRVFRSKLTKQNGECLLKILSICTDFICIHGQTFVLPVENRFQLLTLSLWQSFRSTLHPFWTTIRWFWAEKFCPRRFLTWAVMLRWTFTWRAFAFLTRTSTGSSASTSVCWSPSLQ